MDVCYGAEKAVIGFDDGKLSFFDFAKQKMIGEFLCSTNSADAQGFAKLIVRPAAVTHLRFLKSGRNLLVAFSNGAIYLLYVLSWDPLIIDHK